MLTSLFSRRNGSSTSKQPGMSLVIVGGPLSTDFIPLAWQLASLPRDIVLTLRGESSGICCRGIAEIGHDPVAELDKRVEEAQTHEDGSLCGGYIRGRGASLDHDSGLSIHLQCNISRITSEQTDLELFPSSHRGLTWLFALQALHFSPAQALQSHQDVRKTPRAHSGGDF